MRKGIKVALGAASLEGGSLAIAGPKFSQRPGKSPAPEEYAAFGLLIRPCIYNSKWCENPVPLGSEVPLHRILENQNYPIINHKCAHTKRT